ncbi:hypothetical protein FRB95_003293 [Tulasnella sp. JGI-2019a]|nr:hypothetical protein FRB95_003293 [Tulasnella sp. JGI-2019a]
MINLERRLPQETLSLFHLNYKPLPPLLVSASQKQFSHPVSSPGISLANENNAASDIHRSHTLTAVYPSQSIKTQPHGRGRMIVSALDSARLFTLI